MEDISDDLKRMGFMPTGEESPIVKGAELWTNGHEMVCAKSGTVIDGDHNPQDYEDDDEIETRSGRRVFRYTKSDKVKLYGGYIGAYNWGDDETPYDF